MINTSDFGLCHKQHPISQYHVYGIGIYNIITTFTHLPFRNYYFLCQYIALPLLPQKKPNYFGHNLSFHRTSLYFLCLPVKDLLNWGLILNIKVHRQII